jgi:hypothetical protein
MFRFFVGLVGYSLALAAFMTVAIDVCIGIMGGLSLLPQPASGSICQGRIVSELVPRWSEQRLWDDPIWDDSTCVKRMENIFKRGATASE